MSVYVVTVGYSHENWGIVGIFSTVEKAEECLKTFPQIDPGNVRIQMYELDKPVC